MDEKRRSVRIEAIYLFSADGENRTPLPGFNVGRTLDVSRGGIAIEMAQEIPPGAKLIMDIGVGEHIVEAQCEVVYCVRLDNGMVRLGAAFTSISSEDQDILLESV
ncbi:MAG: PilZ domain-containing protein [Deltaproteobacteria bacterium]|nr:PilZ domain-containing protein [Deltaproteobacteria bacterium]